MGSLLPSEVFYFPSQAQSNIYNLTYVRSENKKASENSPSQYDLLVAYYRPVADPFANKRCCFIYRFSSDGHSITSVTKHMDFVYLPGASDIVCINALFDELNKEYVVGIGFVKDRDKGYLNIYGADSMDKLSECCLSFSALSCVPLHLTHTYYISPTTSKLQWAFILSSGNPFGEPKVSSPVVHPTSKKNTPVRVIAQLSDTGTEEQNNKESELSKTSDDTSAMASNSRQKRTPSESINTIYGELSTETATALFPELRFCPNVKILYMDFRITTTRPFLRLAAFGAQDGWFGVCQTDMERCTVLRQFSFSHESPITHVKLFNPMGSEYYSPDAPSLQSGNLSPNEQLPDSTRERMDLLVCSAFESTVVYTRILEHGALSLENQLVLPQSVDFDHVSCASVGDFNFDGYPEIVLGTFGQRLLFYQWDPLKPADDDSCPSVEGGYRLIAQQALIGPIHCISPPLDLAGDGLDAMVVLSGRGLHVYQHCVDDILDLLQKRVNLSSKAV